MHILQIKVQVDKNKEQEFLQAVRSAAFDRTIEKYKSFCVVHAENPGLHRIEFSFDSVEDAEVFKQTTRFKQIIGICEVLGELYTLSSYKPVDFSNIH